MFLVKKRKMREKFPSESCFFERKKTRKPIVINRFRVFWYTRAAIHDLLQPSAAIGSAGVGIREPPFTTFYSGTLNDDWMMGGIREPPFTTFYSQKAVRN